MIGSSFESVGLIVSDMDRTLEFYRLLGLDLDAAHVSEGMVDATLPGGIRVMFVTEDRIRKFEPAFQAPEGRGRMSLAFRCKSPLEVDALFDDLVQAGFDAVVEPFDVFWGHRYATVLDPDGTRVDLVARLPGHQ